MMNEEIIFNSIYNIENLFCAWRKVKNIYDTNSDFIFNITELANFEANLDENLIAISTQIKNNEYTLNELIPLWLPKACDPPEARQNFYISVIDQIVWVAIINILGPFFDDLMPFWSFGNRLYMPIWKEDSPKNNGLISNKKVTRFGNYSSSSIKLYRNWSSSWPLFRKAISITVKKMASLSYINYTQEEQEEIDNQEFAPESFKIKYWEASYWNKSEKGKDVYYATIDLKKFYPNIGCSAILNSLAETLKLDTKGTLFSFLKNMLDFRVDSRFVWDDVSENLCRGIDKINNKVNCIPTGLFVAGFLSNIAMLPVDMEVYKSIETKKNVAHFRFVDDHVFLAYDIKSLYDWIMEYEKILKRIIPNMEINVEKIEPKSFQEYYINGSYPDDKITECKLNVNMPTPFTTLTLQKLSCINTNPFDLLDTDGKTNLLKDIEHILSTDFPDEEIKKDTRVSWAASLMIRLVPLIDLNINDVYNKRKELEIAYKNKYKDLTNIEIEYANCKAKIEREMTKIYKHVFNLLIKAIDDNIEKPKLWKKAVSYCRATGYSGLKNLIELLEQDERLTKYGKEYLLATILFSLCINIASCINVSLANYYTEKEKNSAKIFVQNTNELMTFIEEECSKYKSNYIDDLLNDLKWVIDFYHFETGKKEELHITLRNYSLIWIFFPYAFSNTHKERIPRFIKVMIEQYRRGITNEVIRHLLLMYPSQLNSSMKNKLSGGTLSPVTSDVKFRSKVYKSLQTVFIDNKKRDHSMLSFEWTILTIFRKVLDLVEPPKSVAFSFDSNLNEDSFINCAPCNFIVESGLLHQKNWEELNSFLKNAKIKYSHKCSDYRFDSLFYNFSSIANEKRQVYSCAVLLICLLTGNMDFDPMIGRAGRLERNYRYLIRCLKDVHISSYTQAIIIGALSDKKFELQNRTILDLYKVDGQDRTNEDTLIEVETILDFKREIDGALQALKYYQLSLQDKVPKQLIPISLKNLTKDYNPYKQGSDDIV